MSRVVSSLVVLSASNPRTLIISFLSLRPQGDPRPPERPPSPPRLTARVNPTIYVIRFCLMWYGVFDPYC